MAQKEIVIAKIRNAVRNFYYFIIMLTTRSAAPGIPAAISNVWLVDNESTYCITELFFKYLSQGLPTDVALQKSKLEFINSSSSIEKYYPVSGLAAF